jgi:hypothetical protein
VVTAARFPRAIENRHGDQDLAVANRDSGNVTILENR